MALLQWVEFFTWDNINTVYFVILTVLGVQNIVMMRGDKDSIGSKKRMDSQEDDLVPQ